MMDATKVLKGQHRSRPKDERFPTYDKLRAHMIDMRDRSSRRMVDLRTCHVEMAGDDLALVGRKGTPARLTDFSYSQLCSTLKVPGSYIAELPPRLGIDCLNHALKQADDSPRNLLIRNVDNKQWRLSGINGPKYAPIWNADILDLFDNFRDDGWDIAHQNAAYAADHNMVAFLTNPRYVINDGSENGLQRGLVIGNSETGGGSFFMLSFSFRLACSNMIIFGITGMEEMRLRHIGDADRRVSARLRAELERYASAEAGPAEALIAKARKKTLGGNRAKVIDCAFGKDVAPRNVLEPAFDLAANHADVDGDPHTVWGLVQGITRYSQTIPFGDKRLDIDRSASRLLRLAA